MKRLNPDGLPEAIRYRQVVEHEASGLIYVSGQIGWNEAGELVGDTIGVQFQQICRNWDIILDALSLDRSAFVKITNFVTSRKEYYAGVDDGLPTAAEQFATYFKGNEPAATFVEVADCGADGLKIEVEAVLARRA